MNVLGILEVLSKAEHTELMEGIRELERQLEDVGWMRLNQAGQESHQMVKDAFDKMVKRSRFAYIKNPIVAQAVHLTTWYTFGDGIGTPKAGDRQVQEIVKEFWEDPDNRLSFTAPQNQLLLSNKIQYDGELMLALKVDLDGAVYVRVLDPLEFANPIFDTSDNMRPLFYRRTVNGKAQYLPDWQNGAALLRDAAEHRKAWEDMLARHNITEPEVLPNTFIYCVRINCDILDKRGVPEVYRALDWVNANSKINSDTATFINAQAQYAIKKKVEGTKQQIQNIRGRLQQNRRLTNPSYQAGSTWIGNEKVDMEAVGLPASSGTLFETGIRRSLLMICAAFGIMEHYFGDPSTGNLATSKSMELPMLKKFLARRKLFEGVYDDVLQFQLNMRLLAVSHRAFDYNPVKNRLVVRKTRDYSDRLIDTDFPPILEKDIKDLAEAMDKAHKGQLIPTETAQRLFMQGAGVNNIDDELKKEFHEPEPPMPAPGFGGGRAPVPAPAKKKGGKKVDVVEVGGVKYDVILADGGYFLQEAGGVKKKASRVNNSRIVAVTAADMSRDLLTRVNGYTKMIAGAYNALAQKAITGMDVYKTGDQAHRFKIQKLSTLLSDFQKDMLRAAATYYPKAVDAGERYVRAMSRKSPAIKEADEMEAFTFAMDKVLEDELAWNEGFVKRSLVPALRERIEAAQRLTYQDKAAATGAMRDLFEDMESRVGMYGNALWKVGQTAVKDAAQKTGGRAWFVGVEDDDNCPGCRSAIAGNPWPVDRVPVPGNQECMTNCRHAIQLEGDEPLTEADVEMLRDAENESKKGYKLLDRALFESKGAAE